MSELKAEISKSVIQTIRMAKSEADSLVPVIGAGTSLALGAPNWKTLVHNLAHRGRINATELESLDPPSAIEEVKSRMGETAYISSVQHELYLPENITSTTLQALVSARVKRLITTNLDYSIENAFRKAGIPIRLENVGRGHVLEELKIFDRQSSDTILLKIHGSLERPSTWVMTNSEYDEAYVKSTMLSQFFSTKVQIPLFIGFSFSDHDVNQSLRIAKLTWGKKAYSIVHIDEAEKLLPRFKQIGVIPIPFFTFDQIPEIVDEIFQCSPIEAKIISNLTSASKKLMVGAAEIDIPDAGKHEQDVSTLLVSVLSNAFEVRPNKSVVDERPRRTAGQKGDYREEVVRLLKDGNIELLAYIMKAVVQYPEILFDGIVPAVLYNSDLDQFSFFKLFFESTTSHAPVTERMEALLLANLHNPKLEYKCLRAISKILAIRTLHPAMRLPPLTVRVGNLDVSVYLLTRYQVGSLKGDAHLKENNPVRPYTLQSQQEIEDIIRRINVATGLNWRAPSSAEWLDIAKGKGEQPWPWGKEDPKYKIHGHLRFINMGKSVAEHPLEVGIFPKGASEDGIHDLVGNVYEIITHNNGYAFAGGAWSTSFKTTSRFHMISGWGKGGDNVGLRLVKEGVHKD